MERDDIAQSGELLVTGCWFQYRGVTLGSPIYIHYSLLTTHHSPLTTHHSPLAALNMSSNMVTPINQILIYIQPS